MKKSTIVAIILGILIGFSQIVLPRFTEPAVPLTLLPMVIVAGMQLTYYAMLCSMALMLGMFAPSSGGLNRGEIRQVNTWFFELWAATGPATVVVYLLDSIF